MNIERRSLLKGIGGLAVASAFGGCRSPYGFHCARTALKGDKLKFGVIGAGGKGFSDWTMMFEHGELPVAICDVDSREIDKALAYLNKKGFDTSSIALYSDYRKMLDDQSKLQLDMVNVSTPDHMHAAQAISAMKLGINCYVQKPLVRTLWEVDYFNKVAKSTGAIVQMGNQGSAAHGHRRHVELLQKGLIGDITEVYVWTDRPVWLQGNIAKKLATGSSSHAPASLDWNSWLGTAADRPYPADRSPDLPWPKNVGEYGKLFPGVFHRFNWRGFYDFGAGAFGDMACHTMNLPFRGAELGTPLSAECVYQEELNDLAYPTRSHVKVVYASRKSRVRSGVTLPETVVHWYDGRMLPSDVEKIAPMMKALSADPLNGCVLVGTKGMLASLDAYGIDCVVMLNGEKAPVNTKDREDCRESVVAPYIPRRKGTTTDIFKDTNREQVFELCEAIRGEGPVFADTHSRCFSDVDYAVPIMEGMLIGCMAQRVPGKLNWDSANQMFDNRTANEFIRPHIRGGWEF